MKIYFSAVKKNERLDILYGLGARNFLFSYEDKKVINQVSYLAESAYEPCTILIDSGAFSAWNRGAKIDINEYISFIDEVKKIPMKHDLYFINLDVIPHEKGKGKPTKDAVARACEKGIENWHYIHQRGHDTIHTFHQFEEFRFLDTILRECNPLGYIGISPANDQSVKSRNRWLDDIFYHLRDRTRTHVLGLTAIASMEKYPAYSADSSTWLNSARFGEIFNYRDLTRDGITSDLSPTNIYFHDPKIDHYDSVKYFIRLESYITKLWKTRGITWQKS